MLDYSADITHKTASNREPDTRDSIQNALKRYDSGTLIIGDCREILPGLESESIRCCVTSPPYWGLRDYGVPNALGNEPSIDKYLENLVLIFREIRRVLKKDGTLWLNIGDSYTSGGRTWRSSDGKNEARGMTYRAPTPKGLKPKELVGIPWRLALALQADGWYLRSDNIWYKPNCQPESVKDRPTRSHEYLFLFSKSRNYHYDHFAIQEAGKNGVPRNKRTVWQIGTEGFPGAHFAVFPTALVRPCVLAGSNEKDFVLDPFFGSGTVGVVCQELKRFFIGIELNKAYAEIATSRLTPCPPIPTASSPEKNNKSKGKVNRPGKIPEKAIAG